VGTPDLEHPDLEHHDLTAMGLFFEAHAGLRATLERRLEQDCGLPVQWFEVLLRLARTPGERLRMSELAAQSSVTASGLTRVVDRLVEAHLVERESCPEDRRSWYAHLTSAGRDRIYTAVPAHLRDIREVVGSVLTDEELATFALTLRKLRDALNPAAAGELCQMVEDVAADAAAASTAAT
jgi:MarR family transcriptional regulator, 2-MHQ and catechol-resistance regulon repressor